MDWFLADTHFQHGNILKYCNRPWLTDYEKEQIAIDPRFRVSRESCEAMDAHLIDNINKHVKYNDVLWHLGDFCFAPKDKYYETAKRYRQRINCKNIIIIWGNHDRKEIANLFSNNYDLHMIRHTSGQRIVVCHYLMAIFEGSHKGNWHLFGHSHSSANPWVEQHMPNARVLDVGVDNVAKIFGEYRPLSFDEIKDYMSKKSGQVVDNHKNRYEE